MVSVPNTLAGKRVDVVLQQLLPEYSRSRLQTFIKSGKVSIDEKVINTKHRIDGGEEIVVEVTLEAELIYQKEPIPLTIVYEDSDLLVLNKDAGVVVHPGNGNWSGTLLNGLLYHEPRLETIPRAGIVHRLDKDTTGLMVVAKTLQAQTHLIRQLQERQVNRHYLALVHGEVKQDGAVEAAIGRHPKDRVKMAVVPTGKFAKTHYTVREKFQHFTLLECKLETGRTHQIRVHMQYLGHPLVGDPVYGMTRKNQSSVIQQTLQQFNRQALHAFRLGLIHPRTSEPMVWEIPLNAQMEDILEVLRDSPN